MAEFKEVLRNLARMCNSNTCRTCELENSSSCSLLVDVLNYDNDIEMVERTVLKWAAKHPEPKPLYPTFAEWQKENFPDNREPMMPCSFMHISSNKCNKRICRDCAEAEQIPEDVAKKLGIEPKLDGEK